MGRLVARPWTAVVRRCVLLALVAALAACTSADQEGEAAGRDQPASGDVEDPAALDRNGAGSPGGEVTTTDVVDGAGEELGALEVRDPADIGLRPRVRLPVVPAVTAPDLSAPGALGAELSDRLAGLVQSVSGVDVIGASCDPGEKLVYQGANGDSFFELAPDGSGTFRDREGRSDLEVTVEADGSGSYRDLGDGNDVEIVVEADGSGFYREDMGTSQLEIVVESDGAGILRDQGDNVDVEIVIAGDGSGSYRNGTFSNDLSIVVEADGSGLYRDRSANKDITIELRADGSLGFTDRSHNLDVELVVRPDGSGHLRDHSGGNRLDVVVDAEGRGTMVNDFLDFAVAFTTDVGILDPDLLDIGPLPVFAVADRFPPLDSLARLEPPCATVVRLGSDVLFDFDSAELRPETLPIIDQLAEALTDTGGPIEIHGHTDAVGDEAYNQDLAGRRAAAFAAALVERGVTAELRILSFGETRPAAPNERPDGSDDPAGRQLNRRIEVVVAES